LAEQTQRPPKKWPKALSSIAVQQMANAIKKISVARGYDVTRYTLQCFGGAGGQHACLVADALGMTRVLVHPLAGVLSAYGMGLADQNVIKEQAVERVLEAAALPTVSQTLRRAGRCRRGRAATPATQHRHRSREPPRACALRGQRLGAGGALGLMHGDGR
jgi:5-oxoprolinase (ATP-hydrolysing)